MNLRGRNLVKLSSASTPRWLACGVALMIGCKAWGAGVGCWSEFDYAASNGWLAATTSIRFEKDARREELLAIAPPEQVRLQPAPSSLARIHVSFKAMLSKGELDTWYASDTLAAYQSMRISHGKESRAKVHRFLRTGVWRERRDPTLKPAKDDLSQWKIRSAAMIPYPQDHQPNAAVLTPLLLLQRASELVMHKGAASEQLVFTDTQLYRVRLVAAPAENLDADYRLQRGKQRQLLREARPSRRVSLIPILLGQDAEDEPFSLLELSGDLAIFIDTETGLPLRIQGTWLRVGTVPVNLVRAKLDDGCGE
jgi:hypothetical protein